MRSESTRQKILDSSVELFGERGFGSTGIVDIVERAGLTKGAFYHHFATKEAAAAAIINDANSLINAAMITVLTTPSHALEKLITAAFVVTNLNENDQLVKVGNLLRQSLIHVSPAAADSFNTAGRGEMLVHAFMEAAAEGDLRDDVDPEAVGYVAWASMLGSRMLAHATGANAFDAVERVLRVVLAGVVSEQSAPYCTQFITRMALQYAKPDKRASLSSP